MIITNSIASPISIYVDGNRCRVCGRCPAQRVCKVKAVIRIDRDESPFVDVHRCYGCMLCVLECPFDAIIAG